MKKGLQVNIWVAAVGFFALVQLGFWAAYFFIGGDISLLLFAAIAFVVSVLFTLGMVLMMRFVPEDKRVRWGIPIMSVVVLIDLALLSVEIVQGMVQAKTLLTIPLHVAILMGLWWLKHRHKTQSKQSGN